VETSPKAFSFIQQSLAHRKASELYRQRNVVDSNVHQVLKIDGQHYLNFASNDYLGLSQHDDVLQSYAEGLSLHGAGSGASPVVTGYSIEHSKLEAYICTHLNKQSAILFSSGFAANQALCQALFADGFDSLRNNDSKQIIADKFMHASFVDAAAHSGASFKRFKHNDYEHLQKLLTTAPKDTLVATEGVFSMDGDSADIPAIYHANAVAAARGSHNDATNNRQDIKNHVDVSTQNHALLMVDDAHAIGVLGGNGMGTCDESFAHRDHVDIVMGTFGKAVGTSGAFIAGSSTMIDYLVNFARHYIYSTSLPAAVARASLTSFELIRETGLRAQLHGNIKMFRDACHAVGLEIMPSQSAIQGVIVGSPSRALACAQQLKHLGIWLACIRTPTVPKNTDRLRITLSASHQARDIQALVDALSLVLLDDPKRNKKKVAG